MLVLKKYVNQILENFEVDIRIVVDQIILNVFVYTFYNRKGFFLVLISGEISVGVACFVYKCVQTVWGSYFIRWKRCVEMSHLRRKENSLPLTLFLLRKTFKKIIPLIFAWKSVTGAVLADFALMMPGNDLLNAVHRLPGNIFLPLSYYKSVRNNLNGSFCNILVRLRRVLHVFSVFFRGVVNFIRNIRAFLFLNKQFVWAGCPVAAFNLMCCKTNATHMPHKTTLVTFKKYNESLREPSIRRK